MAVKKRAVTLSEWYNRQDFIAAFLKSCRRYKWRRKDEAER